MNVSRAYTVNGLNQYITAGSAAFTYDANGNLTGDGTSTYGYDVENRLTGRNGGLTRAYDPLGRLWRTSGGAYGKTDFVYDGDQLAAEYDGDTGGMRRRYMFAGEDEPVLWDEGSAMDCTGTRFVHTDERGSVIALADCWGNRQAVNGYDEYGIPAAGNTGRFQYTGQAWLPDLGAYYYKAAHRTDAPAYGSYGTVAVGGVGATAGGGGETATAAGASTPPPAIAMIPAAMLPAPNSTKQPSTTPIPRRASIRPFSIRKPTDATAITATAVATLPSIVPCTHAAAAASVSAPEGSASDGIGAKLTPAS